MGDADLLMQLRKRRAVPWLQTVNLEASRKLQRPFSILLGYAPDEVRSDFTPTIHLIEDPFEDKAYPQHGRQAEAINVYIVIVSRRPGP